MDCSKVGKLILSLRKEKSMTQKELADTLKHDPRECVGYIVTLDGVKIYCSGDTSKTAQMESFVEKQLDYALFPTDGVFNMGLEEAAECARLIGAKHNIPIHMNPLKLFDKQKAADKLDAPNKLVLAPGQEIELKHESTKQYRHHQTAQIHPQV